MSAVAAPPPRPRSAPLPVTVDADLGAPLAGPARLLRLVSFAALAAFCALHWAGLVRPAESGTLLAMTAVAVGAGTLAWAAGALPRWWRALAVGAVVVVALAAGLLAAGVPRSLLAPSGWGSLGTGLDQGIVALPGITVPYRGAEPWVRIVVLAGGAALLLLAALLAARSARARTSPLGAAVVLAVGYVVAVLEHTPHRPFLGGAAFAVLLAALLWAHRVERRHAPAALVFVVLAALGGMLAGPRLDGSEPWLDYEQIAESLTTPPSTSFDWNHGYGPLHWPRDGREVLRVQASRAPAYWKAADLDTFDGYRWRVGGVLPTGIDTQVAARHPEWRQRLTVDVRNLRTTQYLGAGVTLTVAGSPSQVLPATPGTFVTGARPLRRGDAYVESVYTPRPSVDALEGAGTRYPPFAGDYLTMALPAGVGGPVLRPSGAALPTPVARLQFSAFGTGGPPAVSGPDGYGGREDGAALLRRSAYGPVYALAQRLRAKAKTPYDYALAVEDHLAHGYAYTESPPARRIAIPAFLFRDKVGYCQQFSGAMALLLRMAGVPARVSSGFASGTFDPRRRDWVVRDLDAHSWVEAYFPGSGWVTLDPTPQVAPPRGQIVNTGPSAPSGGGAAPSPAARDRAPHAPAAPVLAPAAGSSGGPWTALGVAGGVLALLAAATLLALRRARRVPAGVPPELAELERALRWTGRAVAPPLTLRALERRFARHEPEAAAYVAAVRATRYANRPAAPSEAQRAALRRELGQGLGPLGRLRARLALPPRRAF